MSRKEMGTVRKVSVVNFLNMNVNSHLQTVSFIELDCGDENPTNPVSGEDNGSLNVSANLPDELIFAEDNEILTVGDQVREQFSHEKQEWRKQQLKSLYNATLNPSLSLEDKGYLLEVLAKHHSIFSLEDERGETSLVEFAIDTGDVVSKKQAARRIPHAAREKINNQLAKMQIEGVIQPSESLWASPVVLVRKRYGSLRFVLTTEA